MIIARCPACQTVFRARSEQLSAHGGRVRCGHCLKPFNAIDNLVVEAPDAPSPAIDNKVRPEAPSAHREPPQTPSSDAPHGPHRAADTFFVLQESPPGAAARPSLSPWILEEKAPDSAAASYPGASLHPGDGDDTIPTSDEKSSSPFERMADRLDFVMPDEFRPSHPKSDDESTETFAGHSSLDDISSDLSRMEGTSRIAFAVAASADPPAAQADDAHLSPDDRTQAPARVEEAAHLFSEIDSSGGAVIRRRSPGPELDTPVTPAPPVPEAPDAEKDEAPGLGRYGDTQNSPGKRWRMGLVIGILLGTLGAQVAYNFRVDITRNWPELRPVYLKICTELGCELPLPRVATAIRITNSNLESDPNEPTRFVLNAGIANQARHPLAFPHLELTLTDARDRSIVRRVLNPDEWAHGADTSAGLAAGEEIEISLAFGARDLTNATGYRVYAFYP